MTPESPAMRLAVAAGVVHLPRMHFVVAHAAVMRDVRPALFANAVAGADLSPVPVFESLGPQVPLPYSVKRRAYPAARRLVGRRLRSWRPDVINLHFMSLGGFAAEKASAQLPLVTTVHAVEPYLTNPATSLRQRALRAQCERVLDESTQFQPVSSYIARWLTSVGVEQSRIRMRPQGIDQYFWRSGTQAVDRQRERRVLFIGHLTRLKGIRDLLRVSARVQATEPHELSVVGDGPLKGLVTEAVLEGDAVKHHGVLGRAGIRTLLERTTVCVLPTQPDKGVEEATAMVLIEAQSMGVPVLAYDCGGVSESVASSDALVPLRDEDELADKMVRMLRLPPDDYAQKCVEAREWVLRERSLEVTAEAVRQDLMAVREGLGS